MNVRTGERNAASEVVCGGSIVQEKWLAVFERGLGEVEHDCQFE
jgi:hypothetical protein